MTDKDALLRRMAEALRHHTSGFGDRQDLRLLAEYDALQPKPDAAERAAVGGGVT